jgi:hypothetical protein
MATCTPASLLEVSRQRGTGMVNV